ncbi:MAG TPA: hypothetical protein VJI73_04745 [Candidatus Paceibacterota bacterium]
MKTTRLGSWQAGNGSVMAIVIVITLLLLGTFYIWKFRETATPDASEQREADQAAANEAALSQQSSSDDMSSIEADLTATSFDSI